MIKLEIRSFDPVKSLASAGVGRRIMFKIEQSGDKHSGILQKRSSENRRSWDAAEVVR
jgi:hypothetical protein